MKNAKSALPPLPVKNKIWKLRLKRLSLTKTLFRTLSNLAGTDFSSALVSRTAGQKRYEVTDIEQQDEVDNLNLEQKSAPSQERLIILKKIGYGFAQPAGEEAKLRKQGTNKGLIRNSLGWMISKASWMILPAIWIRLVSRMKEWIRKTNTC